MDEEQKQSELNESGAAATPNKPAGETPAPGKERLGELLKKERITKRITIETIAKDLKLNTAYIKALEAGDYASLPADPYVRVYIRSIAKYLFLDPDEVLKKFYLERGLSPEEFRTDTSTRLQLSAVEKEHSRKPFFVTAAGVLLFALLALFAGRLRREAGTTAMKQPPLSEESSQSAEYDSIGAGLDSLQESLPLEAPPPEGEPGAPEGEETGTPAATPKLVLSIRALKDSVWLQVFSDGISWKNTLHTGENRTFTAVDSLNVHVGNNSAAHYTLNGNALKKFSDTGVVIFKITPPAKVARWSLDKWNRVFSPRL